jgi:hypothetical protein
MISSHPSFVWPTNHDVRIWRYSDLAKFASLLFTLRLFFSRASFLGDPYEGSITKVDSDTRDYIIAKRNEDPKLTEWRSLTDEGLRKLFSDEALFREQSVREFFVSCWHVNEHESAAMWRLYGLASEAICVQSTFSRLAKVLPEYVNVGLISYIDYERDMIPAGNIFNAVLHKRRSFAYEQEIRAVAWERLAADKGGAEIVKNMTPGGLPIIVDLNELIERIYISPTAASWFEDVVNHLVGVHRLNVPVIKSSLASRPLY